VSGFFGPQYYYDTWIVVAYALLLLLLFFSSVHFALSKKCQNRRIVTASTRTLILNELIPPILISGS